MDLALAQVEIDAVVRDDRAESLGYAPELECEGILSQSYFTVVGMSVISPDAIWSWVRQQILMRPLYVAQMTGIASVNSD